MLNVYDGDTLNGDPAAPATASVSFAPGESLPAGITFNTITGDVGVAPGTPPGTYTFDYQICEIAVPDNCEIASVTITVIQALSELSGVTYLDVNGDRVLDNGDVRLGGWTVEVLVNGIVVATTVTAADGSYSFPGLPGGAEYTVRFRDPDSGVVYEEITDVRLEVASSLPDQNLPIDPSGIVYDAITRTPVSGAYPHACRPQMAFLCRTIAMSMHRRAIRQLAPRAATGSTSFPVQRQHVRWARRTMRYALLRQRASASSRRSCRRSAIRSTRPGAVRRCW